MELTTKQLTLLVKCLKEDSEKGPVHINPDISISAFEELIARREQVKKLQCDLNRQREINRQLSLPYKDILYLLNISPEDLA